MAIRLLAENTELRKSLQELVDYLSEAHQEEIIGNHFGDDPAECSYCKAIDKAKAIIDRCAEGGE